MDGLFLYLAMWYLYILYSKALDRYYVGYTSEIETRLARHNLGWGKFTSRATDWELVYQEKYTQKNDAIKRESFLKRMKSRKLIEELIKKYSAD